MCTFRRMLCNQANGTPENLLNLA